MNRTRTTRKDKDTATKRANLKRREQELTQQELEIEEKEYVNSTPSRSA